MKNWLIHGPTFEKPNSPLVWANYNDQTTELNLNVRESPPNPFNSGFSNIMRIPFPEMDGWNARLSCFRSSWELKNEILELCEGILCFYSQVFLRGWGSPWANSYKRLTFRLLGITYLVEETSRLSKLWLNARCALRTDRYTWSFPK